MAFASNGVEHADVTQDPTGAGGRRVHGDHGSANMRIEFANAERPGIDWNRRELRIGSAPDNDLVLAGPGIAAHHLRIIHDARGWVMQIEPGAGRVYLNARQVRERALVRPGDSLGVGDVRLRLCANEVPTDPLRVGHVSLRAVAGPLAGRAQCVGERLDLDNKGHWMLGLAHAPDACVSLVREDDGLHLRCVQLPETCKLSVNGIHVRDTRIRDGDQIAIGAHRFVVDACVIPDPDEAVPVGQDEPLPEDSAGPPREVWWLIVTAAALALVIAAFLFVRL